MLSPRLFRFCSRLFVATYGRCPVLGELRSSIAIVRRGDLFLLQRRSDNLGWAFPGGTACFWETEEQTLRRELREETGLEARSLCPLFVYHDRHFVPSRVSVFAVEAEGELRASWEGEPRWMRLADAVPDFFPAQQVVLDYIESQPVPL
ncbi:MAG TPA: NUDIX domain-containing protein [Terriglobales bacterium]|nr:NUDIX domain-containing protein [Terriglobales bacterium]